MEKILYADAVKNSSKNVDTQNGAQQLSAKNALQISNTKIGVQKLSTQNMAGKTKCEMDPRKTDAIKDTAPENISLLIKILQKAKQTLEDIEELNIKQ
jgi:hypothetical protein